jgi:YfiH family protein
VSSWLAADWPVPANVRAFTTLRTGPGVSVAPFDRFNLGARCGDEPDAVARNRQALIEQAGLPAVPNWLLQVHGTQVVRFDALAPSPARRGGLGRGAVGSRDPEDTPSQPPPAFAGGGAGAKAEPEADAAVTSSANTVLAILTADCLPVLFAAADGSEVAAAHAGWRGLAAGVLEHTVAAMQTSPDRLIAWLGPAAGPQAYEIGAEVFEVFVSRDPRTQSAFAATRPGHWHVDLYALARLRLADAGVRRVSGGGLCTISDAARFYSHRRDQRGGRMATLVYRAG